MLFTFVIRGAFYFIAIILGYLFPRLFKSSKWIYLVSIILSILIAFFVINILKTIPPSKVYVEIIEPKPGFTTTNYIIHVKGKVSKPNSRVYIFIHPGQTDLWWVQEKPHIIDNEMLIWEVECYVGTENLGKNDTYDIVALASIDNKFFDALTGRFVQPGQKMKSLPLLNKSNVLTVSRTN